MTRLKQLEVEAAALREALEIIAHNYVSAHKHSAAIKLARRVLAKTDIGDATRLKLHELEAEVIAWRRWYASVPKPPLDELTTENTEDAEA